MNRTALFVLPTLVALTALDGCAAAYRAESSPARHEPEGSVDDYAARIERLERELTDELRTDRAPSMRPVDRPPIGQPGDEPGEEPGTPRHRQPDCRDAPALRDRICELSRRICSIAERDASDHALAQTCTRAREACDQATLRVDHVCGS